MERKEQLRSVEEMKSVLEGHDKFYTAAIATTGSIWDRVWLRSYSEDDRGFSVLAAVLYPHFSATFNKLRDMTSSSIGIIPSSEKELYMMARIQPLLGRVEEIITEVPQKAPKRGGNIVLLPHEFAIVSDATSRLRIYLDYRNGQRVFAREVFVRGRPLVDVASQYNNSLGRFIATFDGFYNLPPIEEFSAVNYLIVDAHDNSVIPNALTKNDNQVLLREIPERGLNKTIVEDSPEVIESIISSLDFGTMYHSDCTASMPKKHSKIKRLIAYHDHVRGLLLERQGTLI